MTILCAAALTEASSHAVAAAAALSRARREPLMLSHVAPPGRLAPFSETLNAVARQALASEEERLRASGVDARAVFREGAVEEELLRLSRASNVGLVVAGEAGQRLTASVLERLLTRLDTPLLVVRDERPFERWVTSQAPLKVLLALDHTLSAAVARDWLASLVRYGPLAVVATHVFWPGDEYARRGWAVPPPEEGHRQLVDTIRAEVEGELAGLPPGIHARVRLEMGEAHVGEQLLAVAGEEQVDLVVLGCHRHRALGRFWSVSHHVLLEAPMAVACVPSAAPVAHLAAPPRWRTLLLVNPEGELGSRALAWAAAAVGAAGTVHVVVTEADPFDAEREKRVIARAAAAIPPGIEAAGTRVALHVAHGEPVQVVADLSTMLDVDALCVPGVPLPREELEEDGVVVAPVLEQWHLVQALLERTHRPVLVTPPLPA